jgi:hypothetical protein
VFLAPFLYVNVNLEVKEPTSLTMLELVTISNTWANRMSLQGIGSNPYSMWIRDYLQILKTKQWCTHKLLRHFMHLKLALHKVINGKLCVFLMYMYSWDTRIWCSSNLWFNSLLPPCQQGVFFFHVERTKRLWHDCLSSSSLGNRTWTICKSISLNYVLSGKNFRCHTSLLCHKVGRAKRNGKF